MKNNWKSFTSGVVTTLLLTGLIGTALAAGAQRQATLNYSGIKITLDGAAITPTDASGATVEPFTIDGITYLPVRGIANALGLGVEWDQAAQTVKLSTSGAAQTGVRFYPDSKVPMLENVTTATYSLAKPYDGMNSYRYPLSVIPEADALITKYSDLLKQNGFVFVTIADGTLIYKNTSAGYGVMIDTAGPDDGFDDYYIIVLVVPL